MWRIRLWFHYEKCSLRVSGRNSGLIAPVGGAPWRLFTQWMRLSLPDTIASPGYAWIANLEHSARLSYGMFVLENQAARFVQRFGPGLSNLEQSTTLHGSTRAKAKTFA